MRRSKPTAFLQPPNSFSKRPDPQDHSRQPITDDILRHAKKNELMDRRSAAADARASLITAYRAAKTAAEPLETARQAERIMLAEARETRRAERERQKLEDRARLEATAADEEARAIASAIAETQARENAENARIALLVHDEAARKAERDRKYAPRKARKA